MLPTQRIILGLDGRLFFASFLLLALLAFAYSAMRRVRLQMALEYAFAQKRMFRDLYAGIFHIFLFAGFVVLLVRTVALVVEGLVPGYVLLRGPAGDFYTLAKDIFEVLVLIGVGMAVFRRAFARPARLDLTRDAWLILFLIALLIAADLLAEGARTALDPDLATPWAPAVLVAAG